MCASLRAPSTARVVRDHERRGSPPTSGGPRSAVRSKWAVSVSNSGQVQVSVITVIVSPRESGRGGCCSMPGGAAKVSIHGLVGREQREEQQQRRRARVATGAAVLLVFVAGLLSLQLSPDVPRGSTAA